MDTWKQRMERKGVILSTIPESIEEGSVSKVRGIFTEDFEFVLVCGTSTFWKYSLLCRKLDHLTKWMDKIVVVTGGQKKWMYDRYVGADYFAQKWALKEHWYPVMNFYPDWNLGPGAGVIRNTEMGRFVAERKGVCVAFWNGVSPGTKDMIKKCDRFGIETRIIRYKE